MKPDHSQKNIKYTFSSSRFFPRTEDQTEASRWIVITPDDSIVITHSAGTTIVYR